MREAAETALGTGAEYAGAGAMTRPAKGAAHPAPTPMSPAVAYDRRPYHERRAEMDRCPECGDPECYSLVCDEMPEPDR